MRPLCQQSNRPPPRLSALLVLTAVGFLLCSLAPVQALGDVRRRDIRPELGIGGGYLAWDAPASPAVAFDLGLGAEWQSLAGSPGFLLQLEVFSSQLVERRHNFSILATYTLGHPFTRRFIRLGVGPMATYLERQHVVSYLSGGRTELLFGFRDFVAFYITGATWRTEIEPAWCAGAGIRLSTSLFRLVDYQRRIRWY